MRNAMEAVAIFLSNLKVYAVASLMIFICAAPFTQLFFNLWRRHFKKR